MSDLSHGWTFANLEDLAINPTADIVDGPFGSNLKASEYQEEGVPIIRLQNVDRNRFIDKNIRYVSEEKALELQRHSFVAGDLVVTKLGEPLGKATIVPDKFNRGIIVADIVRVRLDTICADKKYVMYAINSPVAIKSLEFETKGTTRPRVNLGHIRKLQISLAPLNEQKRIVEKLDSLLARVDSCQSHLERVPQIIKHFRQSVLAAATTGKLTDKWREEHGLELSDWNETSVSEIAEVFLGRQRSPENHYGEYMRKYVRAANITWNGWDFSDVKEMNFDPQDYERYRLRVGDILLNEGSGSAGEVGKPAVWNGEIEDCCFQNTLICVRPHEAFSKYLYFVFLYAAMSGAFIKEARGLSIFHIGRERLAGFRISLPTLDEQHEIVRQVERLFELADSIVERWNTAQEHTTQLVPSLLAKAFRGELVEQDLNDEPASELLKRIKLSRENMPKETKKSRRQTITKTVKSEKEDSRFGVIQALKTSSKELSSQQLFQLAGYPLDAESDVVEEFFVEVRDALANKLIQKRRRNETDWFSLIKK